MAITRKELRQAVAAIIRWAQPNAIVFDRAILGWDDRACPTELQSPNDNQRINGWIVSITDADRGNEDADDKVIIETFSLRVWHLLQHEQGDDTRNSEEEFEEHCRAVQDALTQSPDLGFETDILGHDQLQLSEMDVYPFTNSKCHLAKGRLAVTVTTILE